MRWHHDQVVIVLLGVLDDRWRWVPVDGIGIVVYTEGTQHFLRFCDDILALLDECVDSSTFDDGDAVARRIGNVEDVNGSVGPLCDPASVMEPSTAPLLPSNGRRTPPYMLGMRDYGGRSTTVCHSIRHRCPSNCTSNGDTSVGASCIEGTGPSDSSPSHRGFPLIC